MQLINRMNKQQSGYILTAILVLLGFCGCMVIPLLTWMGTGFKAVQTYQRGIDQVYAADAGIASGIWQIKTYLNQMKYDTFSQTYPAFTINDNSVVVQVGYTWMLEGIADPIFGPHNQWVDVSTTGNPDIYGVYTVNLSYNDISGNPGNKKVEYIGVWLPGGFAYVPGSAATFADNIIKSEPGITAIHGGTSIKWSNVNYSFQQSGQTATQCFRFTPVGQIPRGDIAWVQSLSHDIGLSWDNVVWNYTLTSTATNPVTGKSTTVTSHVAVDSGTTGGIGIIDYVID